LFREEDISVALQENTECHAFGNKNITQGDYTYVEVPAYVNVQ